MASLMFSDPKSIKMFVLDEADEMLSRGFKDQIYDVFRFMPQDIQVPLINSSNHCQKYISCKQKNIELGL